MMQLRTAGGLGKVFSGSTDAAAYQKFVLRQSEEERKRRDRKDDVRDDETEFLDMAMAIVSSSEIDAFKVDLDRYDTATVEALQENQIELAAVRERMDQLLGQAHVLPDGRRVFKTQDGLRVFDEHGIEVEAATIDPDAIEDSHPRWEQYKPEFDRANELIAQQTEQLQYQSKLDDARERFDAGKLTRTEFDELRDELKADMPQAVRAKIPGMEAEQNPALSASLSQAEELDIGDDMIPTTPGFKASPLAFGD